MRKESATTNVLYCTVQRTYYYLLSIFGFEASVTEAYYIMYLVKMHVFSYIFWQEIHLN